MTIAESQIEEKQSEPEPEICPICRDELTVNNLIIFRCNHKLDLKCFIELLERDYLRDIKCPLCRSYFIPREVEDEVEDEEDGGNEYHYHHTSSIPKTSLDKILAFVSNLLDSNEARITICMVLMIYFLYKKRF